LPSNPILPPLALVPTSAAAESPGKLLCKPVIKELGVAGLEVDDDDDDDDDGVVDVAVVVVVAGLEV
jgi:hypothetical protein